MRLSHHLKRHVSILNQFVWTSTVGPTFINVFSLDHEQENRQEDGPSTSRNLQHQLSLPMFVDSPIVNFFSETEGNPNNTEEPGRKCLGPKKHV